MSISFKLPTHYKHFPLVDNLAQKKGDGTHFPSIMVEPNRQFTHIVESPTETAPVHLGEASVTDGHVFVILLNFNPSLHFVHVKVLFEYSIQFFMFIDVGIQGLFLDVEGVFENSVTKSAYPMIHSLHPTSMVISVAVKPLLYVLQ